MSLEAQGEDDRLYIHAVRGSRLGELFSYLLVIQQIHEAVISWGLGDHDRSITEIGVGVAIGVLGLSIRSSRRDLLSFVALTRNYQKFSGNK